MSNNLEMDKQQSSVKSTLIKSITSVIIALITALIGGEKLIKIASNINQTISANSSSTNQIANHNNIIFGSEGMASFQRLTPNPMPTETGNVNVSRECFGSQWGNCWRIDESRKEMTWIGDTSSNADIGFEEDTLFLVRSGYTAKIKLDTEMWINICIGAIDGRAVQGKCPVVIRLEPGEHIITSPGPSGGFRIYN